jgi:hypothetical protein
MQALNFMFRSCDYTSVQALHFLQSTSAQCLGHVQKYNECSMCTQTMFCIPSTVLMWKCFSCKLKILSEEP